MSEGHEGHLAEFKEAIRADNRKAIATLLRRHAEVREALDVPLFKWGQPALAAARTPETADLLLQHGASATPLHFARTVETAKLLIDHGAQLDARDDDHDSTPAQWLIGERPKVARYLLERGANRRKQPSCSCLTALPLDCAAAAVPPRCTSPVSWVAISP